MNEYLDVYDIKNQKTEQTALRSEIHTLGLWHRTVHIYVLDANNRLLVHLRSPKKDLNPNRWDTRFGGHLVAGQDYSDAALKELEEEIGLSVNIDQLQEVVTEAYDGGSNKEFVRAYKYLYDGELKNLSFNDQEVVEVKWMTPVEISNSMESNKALWTGSSEGFKKISKLLKI